MILSDLLASISYIGSPDLTREVTSVVSNSKKIVPGCVFVCIKGRRFDGHSAAQEALNKGASAVVCDHTLGLADEVVVDDTRVALAALCRAYFGHPERKLTLIAVTGTNGKTTITNVIKQSLEAMGIKTGLIGTIRCEIGDRIVPAKFTTPEPWDLCALFARMVAAGCTHVVMEASSQALDQGRLLGLTFAAAVFTNLTPDHLDYHGDMENYYLAKKQLFLQTDTAVVNVDNDYGQRLAQELSSVVTVSAERCADVYAQDASFAVNGVTFTLKNQAEEGTTVRFPMPGNYSLNNALCAAAVLLSLGYRLSDIGLALGKTTGVLGRCEVLYSGAFTVICDYAHTPDALRQLLSSLKPFVKGRFITLFGCAGDRDATKRPEMARVVCEYSDLVVLSSDNPRTEDPLKIMNEVIPYLAESGVEYTAQPDRYFAVRWALSALEPDDLLVLCGKGHEDYQVIDGYTVYLDEHRMVRDFIREAGL